METLTERVVLKDLTCPLIRLDKSRRKDKSWGLSLSLLLHGLLFALVGISLIKPPQFGVDQGVTSIEIHLEAPPMEVAAPEPVEPLVPVKSDVALPEETPMPPAAAVPVSQPVKPPVQKPSPQPVPTITSTASRGAITEAKPDYLSNPAPAYPDLARRRGYEGTVLLHAVIAVDGSVLRLRVEGSSGHHVLDEAALKAVKYWKFNPGRLGTVPIESSVRVPVRFHLKD